MLVRWNAWPELSRLEQVMNRFYEARSPQRGDGEAATAVWQPAVDILEDGEKIVLVADLPGVEQKDVDVSVDKNVLTLRGERKAGREAQQDEFHRVERVHGPFARSFTLPPTVDADHVAAELKQGVLTLTLPKKREAQPRQIKVQLG